MTGVAEPEVLRALFVTYGVLDALDEKPLLGRWFSPADDTPGSPETVILTYGYWQRRFNGDRSILGRTMTINSTAHTVIGVMPEEFRFQRDPVLILPARFERSKVNLGTFAYQGIARLKPGVTIAQANADLARMLEIWLHAWPPPPGFERAVFQDARFGPKIQPLKQEIVGDAGTALWVVMGTLGLVLLIVCANVANLFLVRMETRRQELAIRAALGAGWRRITQEMLVECMTLGVLGGTLGLGLAYAALQILVAKGPATLPRLNEIRIDPLVLAFALGVSLLSGALFGLIPVLKYAGARGAATLGGVGRTIGQSREHNRARNTLVVVQVALALVLLVGSGLMIRTFQQLRGVQPGFTHPEEIQIVHSSIPEAIAEDPVRVMRMWDELRDTLAALPGVTSVGFASGAPLESAVLGFRNIQRLYAEDQTLPSGQASPEHRLIAPGFFSTMGTRLIAGRDFTWTDLYDKRHVAIVSENLAREWWHDPRAALGKRVRESSVAPWREVVGVVEDVYDSGMQVKAPAFAYLPALMDRYLVFDHEYVTRGGTVRDPLEPDGNGGSAEGGAASHLVRERKAACIPCQHAQDLVRPIDGADFVHAGHAGDRWRHGSTARHRGNLRRDRLCGLAEDSRDRHPHRAGCAEGRIVAGVRTSRIAAGWRRSRPGASRRCRTDTSHVVIVVWRHRP